MLQKGDDEAEGIFESQTKPWVVAQLPCQVNQPVDISQHRWLHASHRQRHLFYLPSKGVLLFLFLDVISDYKTKVVSYHPTILIPPNFDHRIKVVFYHPTILILPHEARFWRKYLSTMWGSLIMIWMGFLWNYTAWRKPCKESSGWSCLNLNLNWPYNLEPHSAYLFFYVPVYLLVWWQVIFWVSAHSPTRRITQCMLVRASLCRQAEIQQLNDCRHRPIKKNDWPPALAHTSINLVPVWALFMPK